MKRRTLLRNGLSLAALGPAHALAANGKRGAVVIGVDKAGPLPKLNAAASGARSVAGLLSADGVDVKLITDETQPVTVDSLKGAVKAFVNRPAGLDQLLIYFAGHGYVGGTNAEFWLLSDALEDADAAVSLTECHGFSRRFDIANVVFISDACRARPDSLSATRVQGSLIFPVGSGGNNVTTEVDKFLATRVGHAAHEAGQADSAASFKGIYTECLLDAFRRPYADIVRPEPGTGKLVVPNRRLREFLAAEVPRAARRASITLEQHPDAEVCSDENSFIARVTSNERTPREGRTVASIADVGRQSLGLEGPADPVDANAVAALARASGFDSTRNLVINARGLPPDQRSRTGFTVSGIGLAEVAGRPGVRASVIASSGGVSQVEVSPGPPRAASVALRFPDGSGTVLAAIDGFIASAVVQEGRVLNVTYAPSVQSGMRDWYEHEAKRLDGLHAAVAASAKFGVLRFEGPRPVRAKAAEEFAGRIRMLKGIDPTLGVYAAYAYAEADLPRQVESVRHFMRGDLGIDLFDVAMLSGMLAGKPPGLLPVVPFAPMLSQGWGLLRLKDVRLPEGLVAAREMLRPSLWTTLTPDGMALAQRTLTSGKVL